MRKMVKNAKKKVNHEKKIALKFAKIKRKKEKICWNKSEKMHKNCKCTKNSHFLENLIWCAKVRKNANTHVQEVCGYLSSQFWQLKGNTSLIIKRMQTPFWILGELWFLIFFPNSSFIKIAIFWTILVHCQKSCFFKASLFFYKKKSEEKLSTFFVVKKWSQRLWKKIQNGDSKRKDPPKEETASFRGEFGRVNFWMWIGCIWDQVEHDGGDWRMVFSGFSWRFCLLFCLVFFFFWFWKES